MIPFKVFFHPSINLITAKHQDLNNFFNIFILPKLREESKGKLEALISEEINSQHNSLPCNDGYTAEVYNCFFYIHTSLLVAVEEQIMPPTMQLVIISLPAKLGEDHLVVKNYRLISLLNNDNDFFLFFFCAKMPVSPSKFNSCRSRWLYPWGASS